MPSINSYKIQLVIQFVEPLDFSFKLEEGSLGRKTPTAPNSSIEVPSCAIKRPRATVCAPDSELKKTLAMHDEAGPVDSEDRDYRS